MNLEEFTDDIGIVDTPVDPILIAEMRFVVRKALPSNRA